jgi:PAS domain S-box-containing protein
MRFSGSEQNRRAAFGRRDDEFERLKKERDELLIRERAARAEAEESRERMREVLESIGDAFFALDRQWCLTYVNDRVINLTGQSQEELLGKSVFEAFPELAEGVASAELIRVEEMGSATHLEHYSSKLDRWLSHRVYPSPAGLSVYTTDITSRKKAEKKLQTREEEYRTTFELAGVGKAQADLETGRFLRVNRRLCEITGYEPEELLAKTFTEITHSEDQDREYDSFIRMVRGETDEYESEKRYVRKDGEVVWVRVNATAIRDPEGRPLRTVATIEDTTERKRAEVALLRSEERYRTLFESIDEGFCIIEMMFDQNDEPVDYRFLETNPAFEKHTGLHEATGKRMRELAPNHDAHWFEIYGKVALTGEPVLFVNEAKALDDRWFDVYAFRLGGRKSRKVALIFNNITERRRAEEALRKSEERYKTLYEDNPFMYFTVDKRGTVLSVNRSGAEQLGYTVEEVVGCPVLDIFHEEDKEGVSRYLSMCLQDLERPSSWEVRKVRKNGSILWARENLRIVEGPDGDTIGLLICEDITGRKQAEEQILWQAQLLEQVQAAVISTDLQGTVTYWNEYAEELYGWSREEALGRNIMDLIIGPEQVEVAQEIMERLWDGETWEGEFVVRRKDGSAFPAHVTDSLIYDAQGHAVGVVGVSTDTTERKKAEEERGRLLAHEWRARAEAEERKRISRELHDRVAHSMGVVHQSLELYEVFKEGKPSQAEAKIKLARETTREALDLTRNISRELHNMEAGDGLSSALSNLLKTAVPPGLESSISVEGDESLIPPRVREQLFLILREAVRNAVSHSEAGQLGIEVRVSPERVVGRVEDDGRGFEGTSEDGDDNDVSGRGLHSMRERAELVGGALTLSSAPGSGTKIEASVSLNTNGGGRR